MNFNGTDRVESLVLKDDSIGGGMSRVKRFEVIINNDQESIKVTKESCGGNGGLSKI